MSFANPTPLRIGMTGSFDGRTYRVAGRVVMGMDDGGETYYWNEFNLASDDGESATLVYEETERGGEWRLFTLFEPEFSMTAEDAATKRVGDRLNLDDRDVRVTLVDETRVYHIEGEAPEEVELGDVAHYFNAESGSTMIVVSWTGDEVEYYRGVTFSAGRVATAFNLPGAGFANLSRSFSDSGSSSLTGNPTLSTGAVLKLAAVGLLFAVVVATYILWRSPRTRSAVTKTSAPASPLTVGQTGTLDGKTQRVYNHSIVEVAEVGRIYDRHEYHLFDEEGNRSLLIYGLKPGEKDWYLFTLLQPLNPLSPEQAAALKVGQTVNVDGLVAPVRDLSQAVMRQTEGGALPDLTNGTVLFSFSTQSGTTPVLARWNAGGIQLYRGRFLPAKELDAAFHHASRN